MQGWVGGREEGRGEDKVGEMERLIPPPIVEGSGWWVEGRRGGGSWSRRLAASVGVCVRAYVSACVCVWRGRLELEPEAGGVGLLGLHPGLERRRPVAHVRQHLRRRGGEETRF